jgi:Tripartite tricarboxylate transporter TctB family
MHAWFVGNRRDLAAGILMTLIGIGAMMQGAAYRVGSLTKMGPGFFPLSLGVIMGTCGLIITIVAKCSATVTETEEVSLPPEWFGWAAILGGIAAFVVVGQYGGLLPATFAIVFISALGDRHNTFLSAATLALTMTAISVVVFWWLLKVQFPLLTWG